MQNKNILLTIFIACHIARFSLVTTNEDDDKASPSPDQSAEFKKAYINQLKIKRMAQQEAVKRIIDYKDAKKEKEMLQMMIKQLFKTLLSSLESLRKLTPATNSKSNDPPKLKVDENVATHMSAIIENTAFCADLVLHFPKQFLKTLSGGGDKSWRSILETAVGLTLKTELLDESTSQAIHLMRQELNFIEREPNYVNPYSMKNEQFYKDDEQPQTVDSKKKKKEKKKRGPGLSGSRNANEL